MQVPLFFFPPREKLRLGSFVLITPCCARVKPSKCNEPFYRLQRSSSWLCVCLGDYNHLNCFWNSHKGNMVYILLLSQCLHGRMRSQCFLFHHLADITPKLSLTFAIQNDIAFRYSKLNKIITSLGYNVNVIVTFSTHFQQINVTQL